MCHRCDMRRGNIAHIDKTKMQIGRRRHFTSDNLADKIIGCANIIGQGRAYNHGWVDHR